MKQDYRITLYKYSPLVFWVTILLLFYLFSLGNAYSFLSLPLLLSLHHGCHESAHGTLVPKTWKGSKRVNFPSGCVGFAIFGHNYLLMRWSHSYHHLCGRLHADCTIDMSDRNQGVIGHARYYFLLCGASAVFHEIAGYIYPFLPINSKLLDTGFRPRNYTNLLFIKCQLFVFSVTILLLYLGGIYFVMCRLLFLPLWGLGQNVAHYGVPVGKGKFPEFAARTYRVNRIINFLLYGAGFYHFEHHVMPKIPGLLLWHPLVSEQIDSRLGVRAFPREGLRSYFMDLFRQLSGPYPREDRIELHTSIR